MTENAFTTDPALGKEVETACGGWTQLKSDTPFVFYRDKVVYFCSPNCKELYKRDPLNSCMAGRLLAER